LIRDPGKYKGDGETPSLPHIAEGKHTLASLVRDLESRAAKTCSPDTPGDKGLDWAGMMPRKDETGQCQQKGKGKQARSKCELM
jgi:hypothetical protein